MPLYTYECPKCLVLKTVHYKMDSDKKCPTCEKCGTLTQRKITGAGFAISGPGVYKEGYSGYTKTTPRDGNRYTGEEHESRGHSKKVPNSKVKDRPAKAQKTSK